MIFNDFRVFMNFSIFSQKVSSIFESGIMSMNLRSGLVTNLQLYNKEQFEHFPYFSNLSKSWHSSWGRLAQNSAILLPKWYKLLVFGAAYTIFGQLVPIFRSCLEGFYVHHLILYVAYTICNIATRVKNIYQK